MHGPTYMESVYKKTTPEMKKSLVLTTTIERDSMPSGESFFLACSGFSSRATMLSHRVSLIQPNH